MAKIQSLTLVALFAVACSNAPTAPTAQAPTPTPPPAPVAACASQNTASVTLVNASPNNYTYDVLVDNIRRDALPPGQTVALTVTAGSDHTILSRVTNTLTTACVSTTSFIQCSSQTLTCRF